MNTEYIQYRAPLGTETVVVSTSSSDVSGIAVAVRGDTRSTGLELLEFLEFLESPWGARL